MAVTLTQEMINGAILAQAKYGVPASVTLGQIMLESGGSNPGGLSGLAYNDNNLFGIKAGSSWTGKTATYNTQEWDGSKYVTVRAQFRKYDSVAQSIDDHGKLLSSSTYTNKTNSATNLNQYVYAMGSVYATDPNYANSLLNVINTNNLTKYDTGDLTTSNNYNAVPLNNSFWDTHGFDFNLFDEDTGWGLGNGNNWFGITWSDVIKFIVLVLLVILAIICVVKAFDIHPMDSLKNKVINKVVEGG